jgi:hypothetical protein
MESERLAGQRVTLAGVLVPRPVALGEAPEPEGEEDQHHPEDDGVGADPHRQRQRGRPGMANTHAEGDGEDSGQPEPELAGDLLAQADRGHQLEDAGQDGPDPHVVEQRQRGRRRLGDGEDADPDAHHRLEDQAPGAVLAPAAEQGDQGEHAVDEGVGPEEQDEGREGRGGLDEGDHSEHHGERTPEGDEAPVAREFVNHRTLR